MASRRQQMAFAEWWNLTPSRKAYYKDCEIVDFDQVSERYILLTLQIPLTIGGTHGELVEISTTIIEVD